MVKWPRSTMDSMRASEAPDPGSIPGEATVVIIENNILKADFNSRLFYCA